MEQDNLNKHYYLRPPPLKVGESRVWDPSSHTATPPCGTWWTVVDDQVHLTRMPEPGESLPEVGVLDKDDLRLRGDTILPVIGPDGTMVRYGMTGD
jgi:hypothetical protein